MENVTKLMQMAFAAIVFCIGIACLFFESKTYNSSLAIVRDKYKDDVVYMQYNPEGMVTVTYAELISTLMIPLDYDIIIDGFRIYKQKHTPDQIESYNIQIADYTKTYHYNAYGDVDIIIYTKGS